MEREIRNIIQGKQNKVSIGKGTPQSTEGSDGDQQIRLTTSGLKLYIKYNGKWYYTSLVSD